MKLKISFIAACLFFLLTLVPTWSKNSSDEFPAPVFITVKNYCDFLQARERSNVEHFYNEEIGLGSANTSMIMRKGVPGCYDYSVITGEEGAPMTLISFHDARCYYDWANTSCSTMSLNCSEGNCDQELKSSRISFSISNFSTEAI